MKKLSTTLCCALVVTGTAIAQEFGDDNGKGITVKGHYSRNLVQPVKPGNEPMTFTQRYAVDWVPLDQVYLSALDHGALLEEDEGFDPMPLRFAVPRNVQIDVRDGRWIDVPGGSLWRVQVVAEGAENVRCHIGNMNLPLGAEIKIHSKSLLPEFAGPYRETGPFENGEAWGITAPGDSFIVEYFTPHGEVNTLPFAIDELYHGYRDIFPEDDQAQGGVAGAGSCHNDTLCFSDWSDVSNAACRLLYQGFLCSGQLTATATEDETPLITTANHCISTSSQANSCEFRFRYRRNSCSSGVSNGITSNGAILVDTYATSDSTLLMIEDELPSGVFFVGWTTSSISNGTDITCVHHPSGSHQRISFGDKISNGVCGSSSNYHGTVWNDGTTEGGSSGSALYRNSDQAMVAVLTCGSASCGNPNGTDGYGRFDRAYSGGGFSAFMQAGSDDSLEDSDTCETALDLEPGSYNNLVVKSTDEDWYACDVANGSTLDVFLDFVDGNGDIDGQIIDGCGGTILVNSSSNNNDETFSWTNNTGTSRRVLIRVFLFTDTRNTYSMDVDFTPGSSDPPPANDLCENALPISNGTTPYTTLAASANGPDAPLSCSTTNGPGVFSDVWFSYTAPCTGFVDFNACGADFDNRIVVYENNGSCPTASTTVSGCSDDTCGTSASVTILALEGQNFWIRIGSPEAVGGTGNLVVDCSPIGNPPANDGCEDAIEVSDGSTEFTTSLATAVGPVAPLGCSTSNGPDVYNDVWFTYTAPCTGIVTIGTCETTFDSRVLVYQGAGCPNASSSTWACADDNCGDDAEVSNVVLEGTTLLIRVGSPDDVEGDGVLQINCDSFDKPCDGDLNGDDRVDGADLGLMLSQWGSDGSADINGDGSVDGADLGLLLSAWGDC